MSEKDLPQLKLPLIHQRTVVAKSRMFEIETIDLEFSNGARRQYERMRGSGRGAVMVVPVTDAREFLLIREYAAGTEQYELGFPKGLIDPGEQATEAANRELQEEVGFAADELISLKQITLAPGYFAAKMDILLAQDLSPSILEGDEPEPLVIVKWPIDDWCSLLDWPEFKEARSVTALMLAARHLGLWS
ncbi:ADP compounds hydrolase NudE [Neiella marina]|uniref:ADP compounds hydrolase NudE n=1 Tax=Neiella marina TaxID=508461 RepID=A0A8J2U9I3_9GAMM|nr:ADP compounds hydrolase NudE [Neiella marina]GGA88761.1 ADP compounds hydrolase NudE [Neiella marina]